MSSLSHSPPHRHWFIYWIFKYVNQFVMTDGENQYQPFNFQRFAQTYCMCAYVMALCSPLYKHQCILSLPVFRSQDFRMRKSCLKIAEQTNMTPAFTSIPDQSKHSLWPSCFSWMSGYVWTCCINDSRTDLCSYFSYKRGPGVHGKYPGLHQLKLEDICIC